MNWTHILNPNRLSEAENPGVVQGPPAKPAFPKPQPKAPVAPPPAPKVAPPKAKSDTSTTPEETPVTSRVSKSVQGHIALATLARVVRELIDERGGTPPPTSPGAYEIKGYTQVIDRVIAELTKSNSEYDGEPFKTAALSPVEHPAKKKA